MHNNITSAPASISTGTGYYSTHPALYSSPIGGRTTVTNKAKASSMEKEVQSARGLSGSTEVAVTDQINRLGNSQYTSTGTLRMTVSETVTEGKVHIGSKQKKTPFSGESVVDQDYIGTFQIFQRMTINSSYNITGLCDSWLGCCPPNYCGADMMIGYSQYPAFPFKFKAADQIFSDK